MPFDILFRSIIICLFPPFPKARHWKQDSGCIVTGKKKNPGERWKVHHHHCPESRVFRDMCITKGNCQLMVLKWILPFQVLQSLSHKIRFSYWAFTICKAFIYATLFNPHNSHVKQASIIPTYKGGCWGSEKLLKSSLKIKRWGQIKTQVSMTPNHLTFHFM